MSLKLCVFLCLKYFLSTRGSNDLWSWRSGGYGSRVETQSFLLLFLLWVEYSVRKTAKPMPFESLKQIPSELPRKMSERSGSMLGDFCLGASGTVQESRSICISIKLLKVSAVLWSLFLSLLTLLVELKDLLHALGCNGLRLESSLGLDQCTEQMGLLAALGFGGVCPGLGVTFFSESSWCLAVFEDPSCCGSTGPFPVWSG